MLCFPSGFQVWVDYETYQLPLSLSQPSHNFWSEDSETWTFDKYPGDLSVHCSKSPWNLSSLYQIQIHYYSPWARQGLVHCGLRASASLIEATGATQFRLVWPLFPVHPGETPAPITQSEGRLPMNPFSVLATSGIFPVNPQLSSCVASWRWLNFLWVCDLHAWTCSRCSGFSDQIAVFWGVAYCRPIDLKIFEAWFKVRSLYCTETWYKQIYTQTNMPSKRV